MTALKTLLVWLGWAVWMTIRYRKNYARAEARYEKQGVSGFGDDIRKAMIFSNLLDIEQEEYDRRMARVRKERI